MWYTILAAELIIRSYERPDARAGWDDFGDMLSEFSLDHDGESEKLYTLFSAPDYSDSYVHMQLAVLY